MSTSSNTTPPVPVTFSRDDVEGLHTITMGDLRDQLDSAGIVETADQKRRSWLQVARQQLSKRSTSNTTPADQPPTKTPKSPTKVPIVIGRGMDAANTTALNVLNTQGEEAFVKHVFTDQDTGNQLSYAEMRMMYG